MTTRRELPSMTKTEALEWIAETFEEPVGHLTEETPRAELAGWDSLGVLTLMAGLDEKFDIHLTENDIAMMTTVKDILDLFRKNNVLDG